MPVGWQDIERLMIELNAGIGDKTPDELVDGWLAENEVDFDVVEQIAKAAIGLLRYGIMSDAGDGLSLQDNIKASVQALGVNFFMVGWDACKQYGGGGVRSDP
jgi:hypothetical protein